MRGRSTGINRNRSVASSTASASSEFVDDDESGSGLIGIGIDVSFAQDQHWRASAASPSLHRSLQPRRRRRLSQHAARTCARGRRHRRALPEIDVTAPQRAQTPRRPKTRVDHRRAPRTRPTAPPQTEAQVVAGKNDKFDEARRNIVAPTGAGSYQIEPAGARGAAAGHQHARSTRRCCRRPAYRRIRPPAANFTSATSTPTCNTASTASCCPTASARSDRSSTPASSAASR